jgi:hypothetical protein
MTFSALQEALSEAITGTQCWTHSHIRIPFNPEHSGKKTEKSRRRGNEADETTEVAKIFTRG